MNNKYTYGKENINLLYCNNIAKFTIGNFCSIGANLRVYLGGNHRTDFITTYPFGHVFNDIFNHHKNDNPVTNGSVEIKNDVWIGNDVTILSGITIGNGAVVGAGSLVTKNIDDYAIVAGNPARLIKYRFSIYQIKKLLETQWWNWDEEKINKNIYLLQSIKEDAIDLLWGEK